MRFDHEKSFDAWSALAVLPLTAAAELLVSGPRSSGGEILACNWKSVETLLEQRKAGALSLAANAFRYQSRWGDALN